VRVLHAELPKASGTSPWSTSTAATWSCASAAPGARAQAGAPQYGVVSPTRWPTRTS
jgi:hypothetical protein